ncbi:MAG: DUF2244 domain-containing protein [Fimbriimonadaceae bacterium]|nr:DUF2244 domain-containing protein [Alphaproteobacteria bacterium]
MHTSSECKTLSAVLTPHRSMTHSGFVFLMGAVAGISLCLGIYFVSLGAWPVSGFFALTVLALYWAFKWNYRDARLREYVYLDADDLRIERVTPSGHAKTWSFNPYWVRLKTTYDDDGCTELALTSHGKTLVVGAFLGRQSRARFADALQTALATHRS